MRYIIYNNATNILLINIVIFLSDFLKIFRINNITLHKLLKLKFLDFQNL